MRSILKLIIALFFIIIHPVLSSSDEGHSAESYSFHLEGSHLNAMVNINGGMYLNHGHPVGFHFELLNRFASHQNCNIKISPAQDKDPWEQLLSGKTDILVMDAQKDSIPEEFSDKVIASLELNSNNQVWVVRKSDFPILQSMNYWFGYYNHTKEYKNLENKYYRIYSRTNFNNGPVNVLSPYDHIIKQYSRQLGWDWRLLASLIYQESKFKVSARSSRNAYGLMQVLPSTAKAYDIDNLYDPEQNIKAGTLFLRRLVNLYNKEEIDSLNKIKLVLAAYNAGEGRVADIQRVAEYKQINQYHWDSLKTVIPLMNHKGEIPMDLLKHGSFKGIETLNFVDEILGRYDNYKALVKK
ncbi:MAG: hypothetical protein EOM16_06905 [Bacteroidia bacterium]|jgi:membrane-bound lytic murein transglycosylase F|nr:transglycosylase SLT domain-containing protein [Bacteroidales bacterium]MDD3299393.1 transglycosylase SLT domain-containing protein [Bacteroidales bacterium]MDD3843373.1 transglycosylase SLT domain-containing protein [Bacteroidales bacterium]MDD4617705.1 transglycosylase SLT domain-containing protein [Bacteroidales bacterium]NCC46747.1 hypothetical protein [Bacteroidia bacterium]